MQAVDTRYLELVDPRQNANKFYLLVLFEDAGRYWVLRQYGARTGTGSDKGKTPYDGPNLYQAKGALNKLYAEKTSEGYKDVIKPPVALQNLITGHIKRGMPTAAGAVAKPTPTPAARPTISVPSPVGTKAIDGGTLATAKVDRSWLFSRIPGAGRRTYCSIADKGPAKLLAPTPTPGSTTGFEADPVVLTVRYQQLTRAIDQVSPAVEQTIFDGLLEEAGPASKFVLIDILRYRDADVRSYSLARRLQLLEQAVSELKDGGQLPSGWSIAPGGPTKRVGTRHLVRHLADKYDPATARWFET